MLDTYLQDMPLVAILRGVTPDAIEAVGGAVFEAGFRLIEIPLNSPRPFESIERLAGLLGNGALVGAGTVLQPGEVASVARAGGRLIVSPNAKPGVIGAAVDAGLVSLPGVATPTEGFAALDAGASGLKLFPAEAIGPAVVRAWRAVLPATVPLLPVGGIDADNMADYAQAGASGFGLGSALYRPGLDVDEVATRARAFVSAWREIAASP